MERSFVGLYLFTLFIINHPFTVRVEFDREIPMFITALTADSQPTHSRVEKVTSQDKTAGPAHAGFAVMADVKERI